MPLPRNKLKTISEYVHQCAASSDTAVAISYGNQKVSYFNLDHKALKIAAHLRNSNISKQQNIGILTQRTLFAYYGILGALYAGCAYVPLNPKFPLKRIASMIKSANISTIIFDESESINCEELFSLLGVRPLIISPKTDLSGISPLKEPIAVEPNHIAYIMFTSGSTGEPKGVIVTHENVCSHVLGMISIYNFTSKDRLSQTFDLSFDPSVSDIFCAWFSGATLCILPSEEVFCPSDYINRDKITFWASVPTLANFLIKLGQLNENQFLTLKHSTFCGEPFPQLIANQWSKAAPNSTIENLYGPTEATVYITRYVYNEDEHERQYANRIVPIGLPLPNQRAIIVDERLQPVPKGVVGELCVSGSQIALGYLNDMEKTNEVFVPMSWDDGPMNRWYRTGDLAFINKYDYIECLGRKDFQIKIGGQRMELGEIESVLREIAQTPEVAAVPVLRTEGALKGIVAFVAKSITQEKIESIQTFCKERLLSAFVPKAIYLIDSLPLNASGKVDRNKLKDMVSVK